MSSSLTLSALPSFHLCLSDCTLGPRKASARLTRYSRLCNNHILATNQRTAQSKVSAVLITDLREFIASGMLTLKTRLEGDEGGLPERMSETWFFFWTRVLVVSTVSPPAQPVVLVPESSVTQG